MSNQLIISNTSADFEQFVRDFESYLSQKQSWKGNLTTMTGQTLIELVSALGAFDQAKISRAYQDAFAETAVSDDAIRACAVMQGIRMTRKLPSEVQVQLTAPLGVVIPAYCQFDIAGYAFFNRTAIEFLTPSDENESESVITTFLYQGEIQSYYIQGNGTNLQSWISEEDSFTVSDSDVYVSLNDQAIPVSYAGLWNYKNMPACMDVTSSSGRLIIQFGTNNLSSVTLSEDFNTTSEPDNLVKQVTYGTVPGINDKLHIIYAVTEGENGNNYITLNKQISIDGYTSVKGKALSNPRYGASEKSTLTYKNNTASCFGTYGSAVTKSQYGAIVNTYPGVVDAITQSQREINPGKLEYMNVIWVTGVTTEPWDTKKKKEFCDWCQKQSMYSTRFVWVDATQVSRSVRIRCYCYNSAVLTDVVEKVKSAITNLFAPRPGILMTNIYKSDIIDCALAADSNISYVVLDEPLTDFIVTQPNSPLLSFQIQQGGSLQARQYSYAVTIVNADGVESLKDNWVHPLVNDDNSQVKLSWINDPNAEKYNVYGRVGEQMGLITTLSAGTTSYTDNGSTTPDTGKFTTGKLVDIKYNSLNTLTNLNVTAAYTDRQQRLDNSLPFRATQ